MDLKVFGDILANNTERAASDVVPEPAFDSELLLSFKLPEQGEEEIQVKASQQEHYL